MAFEIAKAGWLHRQSSVLRRWKRSWFVLYVDGMIKYFDSPDSHTAEEVKLMPAKCLLIKRATQVSGVTPPPGFGAECLLALVFNDETWTLCAESSDDMTSWGLALDESRAVSRARRSPAPPPYQTVVASPGNMIYPPGSVYYGQHYGPHPPSYVVQGPPGQTTVVYADYPQYGYGYNNGGTDVAMGMVAGAALGSMMWGPLLWW